MQRPTTTSILRPAGSRGPLRRLLRRWPVACALGLLLGGAIFESSLAQSIPRFRIKEERAREFFKKGLAFHNTQRYVAAREFYYKALDIQPFFHLARRYLGDAYYYSGEWNSALEQWEFLDSVSDGAYPLVRQRSELLRFSLNQYQNPGAYTFFESYTPTTWREAPFEHPVDIGWDAENNLYILAFESANLIKVNPGGQVQSQITGPLWDRMQGPIAMDIEGDLIYVADYMADNVRVFTRNGNAVRTIGATGSGPGQFRGPSGILVTPTALYVSDSGNRRVAKFNLEGEFLLEFGADDLGQAPRYPAGIALDDEGVLFVADRDERRILRYDTDGNFLGVLASEYLKQPRGLFYTAGRLSVADEENGILFFNTTEQRWRRLDGLRDDQDRPVIARRAFSARTNASGILVVAEYGGHRVMTIVPRGLRISTYDTRIQRIDTANFPQVGVFLTVRNRLGDPLIGMSTREIKVFENDKRIGGLNPANVQVYNRGANIAIAMENSALMEKEFRRYLPSLMGNLLGPLRIADEVSVVRVGPIVREVYKGLERREIIRQLSEGETTDAPNIGKGLIEALTYQLSELGPRAVVLIASGKEFPAAFRQYEARRIVQYARANRVSINVISFEAEDDPNAGKAVKELYQNMAASTGGTYYFAFDDTELKDIYARIAGNLDRRYVITYKGRDDAIMRGRYVDVRVEVEYLGTFGKANAGYFVPEER